METEKNNHVKMFNAKMKIRGIISNGLDFNKYYPGHDPEQYSRDFSRHASVGHLA